MKVATKGELTPSLNGVVKQHTKVHSKDAATRLYDAIMADETLIADTVRWAAKQLVRLHRADTKDRIVGKKQRTFGNIPKGVRDLDDAIKGAIHASVGEFYSWPLMDGSLLGDADREKVVKNADRMAAEVATKGRNANFLRLVATGLVEGQTVRQRYKEKELAALMEEAKRSLRD